MLLFPEFHTFREDALSPSLFPEAPFVQLVHRHTHVHMDKMGS